jgi:hypothetical protein
MRWVFFQTSRPRQNVVRRWFAILPVSIGAETRWLEWVAAEFADSPYFSGEGYTGYSYKAVRFVDE